MTGDRRLSRLYSDHRRRKTSANPAGSLLSPPTRTLARGLSPLSLLWVTAPLETSFAKVIRNEGLLAGSVGSPACGAFAGFRGGWEEARGSPSPEGVGTRHPSPSIRRRCCLCEVFSRRRRRHLSLRSPLASPPSFPCAQVIDRPGLTLEWWQMAMKVATSQFQGVMMNM
jgi:hypothetical protein